MNRRTLTEPLYMLAKTLGEGFNGHAHGVHWQRGWAGPVPPEIVCQVAAETRVEAFPYRSDCQPGWVFPRGYCQPTYSPPEPAPEEPPKRKRGRPKKPK